MKPGSAAATSKLIPVADSVDRSVLSRDKLPNNSTSLEVIGESRNVITINDYSLFSEHAHYIFTVICTVQCQFEIKLQTERRLKITAVYLSSNVFQARPRLRYELEKHCEL